MKRIISLISCFTLLGCATLTAPGLIATAAGIAGQVVKSAVADDLATNPGHRPAYLAAIGALDGLLRSSNYNAGEFAKALAALPAKELQSPYGALIIGAAVLVIEVPSRLGYDVQTAPAVAKVMQSVRDGIAQALITPPRTGVKAMGAPKPAKITAAKKIRI